MQQTTPTPEIIPYTKGFYSVTETDNPEVVWQNSQAIIEHQVQDGYLILAKNDFHKIKKRINVGYFNKKTNFIVGNKKSLIFWDNKELRIVTGNISDKLEETSRYFLVYDMNFIADSNLELFIKNKKTEEKIELVLNKQFGIDIGQFLRKSEPTTTVIPEEFKILEAIIQINSGRLSINKQVLINSNADFLIGILEGYLDKDTTFILKSNINIYNFTYILNLLGAQYSIRSVGPQNKEKQIKFRLPAILSQVSQLNDIFFRSHKYIFDITEENWSLKLRKTKLSGKFEYLLPEEDTSLQALTNRGIVELIPMKDLVFIEIKDQKMFDLTMSRADATNFNLPCAPTTDNSDGDVLAAVAILSEDAATECVKKFSTELKENFLNLGTGGVNNWGIHLDAQQGIYTATK